MTISDLIQIILMGLLVVVTGVYAWRTFAISKATRKQADTSVKMAEEMREQRRPIVVQEAIEPKGTAFSLGDGEDIEHNPSDYFQIRNVGNGPAIELQIVLLDKEKGHPQIQKKVILSQADAPLEFYPVDLANREKTTCYLVCQYRSVLSPDERKTWYETWLPFTPKKSQRGDKIIITPGELEFREGSEKKSY